MSFHALAYVCYSNHINILGQCTLPKGFQSGFYHAKSIWKAYSQKTRNRTQPTSIVATILKSVDIKDPSDHSSDQSTDADAKPPPRVLANDRFVVSGGTTLSGHVHISGAKNSALAVLAGALCSTGISTLQMIPDLHDTRMMMQILRSIGVEVHRSGPEVVVNADNIKCVEPCSEAVRKLRASFFVIGPLLARHGKTEVALPGGCNIGARPIDLHSRGLQALSARVEIRSVSANIFT